MRSRIFNAAAGFAGAILALASGASVAGPITYIGVQAPKSPLSSSAPPALSVDMASRVNAFGAGMTVLGRNEFEGGIIGSSSYGATAGNKDFTYTGGSATLAGGTIVGASTSAPAAGRYNMTAGVTIDPAVGTATGHWLEATQAFTYNFTSFVTALSFFGTDFGDLRGTFNLTLFNGSTEVYASGNIVNNLVDAGGRGNGNLIFVGVLSDVGFDKAVFTVTQSSTAGSTDVLGFDSIVVGTVLPGALPEPSSLALVGLALLGLGAGANRRRKG